MFTGIVQAVGEIAKAAPTAGGLRLEVEAGALGLTDVVIGDSICIQGACMTVTGLSGTRFSVDISRESLDCTVGLDRPARVNLEKSVAIGDKLGGHLVTGHVDGVAEVTAFESIGDSRLLRVRTPTALSRYIARKGSVCLDGVSLTVNRVEREQFEVNLIPHTLAVTTLGRLQAGARINLEVDLIARYVERMVTRE
jgi:riboflavin synthase